jgi:hypothetical protein
MKPLNISHASETFSHLWVQQLSLCCERDHCSWQSSEHCLCLLFQSLYSLCDDEVTFQMCWVYSSRSFMCECDMRITRLCSISWSQRFFKLKKNKLAFTKLSWLCKMLCQTQDCAKQKTLCLLKKMNNNNDDDEKTSAWDLVSSFW